MLRLDFEQAILEMVFEVGYEKLTPASVAYFLRVPIKSAEAFLDQLVTDGVLRRHRHPARAHRHNPTMQPPLRDRSFVRGRAAVRTREKTG